MCLFCYEEEEVEVINISSEEEEEHVGSTKHITTRTSCKFENDDIEEAAQLLYHLILHCK